VTSRQNKTAAAASDALHESEAKFRGLIENSIQGVMIQRDRKILFTNQAYAEMRGYESPEELIGVDVLDLTDPSEHPVMKDRQRRRSRGEEVETNFEALALRRDGSQVWVDCVVSRVDWEGEPATQVTNVDISARKQAEAELASYRDQLESRVRDRTRDLDNKNAELTRMSAEILEAHKALEKLHEQKNKFFSIIAHDLKGPFNVLLGYSKLFSDSASGFDPKVIAERSKDLHASAEQVFKLLENLLEWSQLQLGTLQFDPQPVALAEVLQQNLTLIGPAAKAKEIQIESHWSPGLKAYADKYMVGTIVRNLLDNAVKFTPQGGTVIVTGQTTDGRPGISIQDTGVGMSPERQSRLFKLEETYSDYGTNGEAGTGLGLHICKELIDRQGGSIHIESAVGKGSAFSVWFPAVDV
jgi:PAS domain S-box-containing protein